MYGCFSSALLLFKSYVADRWWGVNLAGTLSDTDELCSGGVPQGYILIHVLFLLLIINDLLST